LLLILPKVRKLACVLAVCSFIYASGKKLIWIQDILWLLWLIWRFRFLKAVWDFSSAY
jgi:hypothetical protein